MPSVAVPALFRCRAGLVLRTGERRFDVFDWVYSLYAVWKMMPSWRIDQ